MKPDLKYSGIVFTLVNMQTNIAKDTIESVKETFGKHIKVYESYIPIATKVSESAIHGKAAKAEQRKVQSTKNRTGYHPDRHDL